MPTKYCLNCSAKADYQCDCCAGATHYCSRECQKQDWLQVHRFELGAEADVVITRETELPRKQREQLLQKLKEERREYQETTERAMQFYDNRVRSKQEMRLTTQQRKQLQLMLSGIAPPAKEARAKERQKFRSLVRSLADTMEALPRPDGTARVIRFGVQEEAALGNLSRKRDLLAAKRSLALATGRLADAEEASQFSSLVEREERQFIHSLLFGEDIGFEQIMTMQRSMVAEQMAERTVDVILEDAFEATVATLADYAASETAVPLGFSSPFGVNEPGGGGEEQLRTNLRNMFQANLHEERATVFSMENYATMANAAIGVFEARQQDMAERGEISEEQRETSNRQIASVWQQVSTSLQSVMAVTSKTGKNFMKRVRDAIAEKVGAVLDYIAQQPIKMIAVRVFCVLSLVSFLLIAYGHFTYQYSPLESLNKVQENLDAAVSLNKQAQDKLGGTVEAINAEKERINTLMGELNREQQLEFLHIDPTNANLDSVTNHLVIDQSLGSLGPILVRGLSKIGEGKTGRITRDAFKSLLQEVERFRVSTDDADRRDALEEIQIYIRENSELLTKAGFTHSIETVTKLINERKEFADTMFENASAVTNLLKKQEDSLAYAGVNLQNAKEKCENTTIGAPFLMTMLRKAGYESYLDATLIHPAANLVANHFAFTLIDLKLKTGLQHLGQIEAHLHKLMTATGCFEAKGYWEWMRSVGYAVFSADFAAAIWHLMTGVFALYSVAEPMVRAGSAIVRNVTPTIVKDTLRRLTTQMLSLLTDQLGFGNDQYDEALQPLIDAINSDDSATDEQRIKKALKLYNDGEIGAVQYGRLIEKLYGKEKIYSSDAAFNVLAAAGTNWMDNGVTPAFTYMSNLTKFLFIGKQYYDFGFQLYYITTWLFGVFGWWGMAGAGLGYFSIALGVWIYNRRHRGPEESNLNVAVRSLLAPFTALMRLTWNNLYLTMTGVYFVYLTIMWSDSGNNVIKFAKAVARMEDPEKKGYGPDSDLLQREKARIEALEVIGRAEAVQENVIGLLPGEADIGVISTLNDLVLSTSGSNTQLEQLFEKKSIFVQGL